MNRIIFHIDVNNAFLSWEAVYRLCELGETQDLRTIPAVIGGDEKNRHGIVLAKSMPAKRYGITTAETLLEARRKCPGLTIVPPRMSVYKTYSKQLLTLLREFAPVIEQYSIDEAFADMTERIPPSADRENAALALAHTCKDMIDRQLGFTVNIGVSKNKLLAKMASNFEKPNRVHSLFPREIQTKMWPCNVGSLFFVGKATCTRLYNLGIRTIGDLARTDPAILTAHLGKHGRLIYEYANGLDDSPVQANAAESKNYGNSITLPHDVTTYSEVKTKLRSLCSLVGRRLQKDHVLAGVVCVSIRYADFSQNSHQCTLASPSNSTETLFQESCRLFQELWNGSPIRLLGVSTSKLTKESLRQLNLLDQDNFIRQEHLASALQDIRRRFGEHAIIRASDLSSTEANDE